MHLKEYALTLLVLYLLAACTTLSHDASRIMTIRDGGAIAMMDCRQLGYVNGDSGVWGGTAGLDAAHADAKNQAAKIPGANAILVTSSRMNPTSYVNATVYDCSERGTQKVEIINQAPDNQPSDISNETMEKARKCQQLEGIWVNDRCIIDID